MTPQLEFSNNYVFLGALKESVLCMADDDFTAVNTYFRSSQYPKDMTKGEKANLRRRCKNNVKFETGMLYYKIDGIDEASKCMEDLHAIRR